MKAFALLAIISALVLAPQIRNETIVTEAPPTSIWAFFTGGR